ncbi:MAG: MobC family plasmid mobilization relaxosome protein [Oscillospiraceae bacterium]|nr:MobC family plasmid mobilization relaxosome protein [Oscillospiraceae bacterium]
MNEEESATLTARAKECGYSREAYIRSLLDGHIPRPMPPPDYHAMMRELHGIGNNLNQIAQKAHILNVVDAGRYDAALHMLAEAALKIQAAVILPVKME